MNLEKCDKCGNRNIMCFLCENNKHYRETKYSHNNFIRNKAIDEFATRIYNKLGCSEKDIYCIDTMEKILEQMKGGATDECT